MREDAQLQSVAVRRLGLAALAGVLGFLVTAVAMQAVRVDLDWRQAPLSFYLLGAYGAWLKAAYFGLAAALVALAPAMPVCSVERAVRGPRCCS